jgi:hypothetical protein
VREIERMLRAYGAACAAEGDRSAAAKRALAAAVAAIARRAVALLPWAAPVRVLAAVYVDGKLDHYLGVRQEGAGPCTVVALTWLARPERRFWGLAGVAAVVAAVREAGALAGTRVEWLDPEAARVWDAAGPPPPRAGAPDRYWSPAGDEG